MGKKRWEKQECTTGDKQSKSLYSLKCFLGVSKFLFVLMWGCQDDVHNHLFGYPKIMIRI